MYERDAPPGTPADGTPRDPGIFPAGRHLFCFGCGYVATRTARYLLAAGARVSGTTRSPEGARQLQAQGIIPWVFDGSAPVPADAFEGVTDVLCSIPPGEAGDDGVLSHHGELLAALPTLRWSGLLSTTGVYGDAAGAWLDESAPLRPGNESSRRRVACEALWRDWAGRHDRHLQVFRLPGIYGPTRSPFPRLRSGSARRIIKRDHVFNRVHVDDIVAGLLLGMQRPNVGPVFHLVDDEPAPADVVLEHAATLLGVPAPPAVAFEDADLPPAARRFYAQSRRLSNRLARQLLGFAPRYPSYREGLAATLAEEEVG